MYDHNRNISPLDFDYVPKRKPVIKMEAGGLTSSLFDSNDPFAFTNSPFSEELTPLVEQQIQQSIKDAKKRAAEEARVEELGDSDATGGPEGPDGAGFGTPASTIAGIAHFLDQVPTSVLALGRKIGKEMFDIDPTDKELTEQANRQLAMRAHRMTQKEFDEQQEALQQAAEQSQAAADTAPTMSESEAEQMQADEDAIAAGEGFGVVGEEGEAEGSGGDEGNHASGGQIKGYQEGDLVEEQADTTMDTAGLGPMGLVDDMAGDQVTGVEDDLDMEVDDGAYVLNADAVELIGLKDLNELTKDAIDIAIESDIPLPKKIDPTKRVPIKISNGEFVIPAILVPIIGLENLEKMNKRGLEYREKNREEEPPQEAQEAQAVPQENIPVEPSEVPSRGVPGEINLAKGGVIADQMDQLLKV
jgi:hypothetical protein